MSKAIDVELRQTCAAYPEQYDAYVDGERVAYLRLRGGAFRVQCPHIEDMENGFLLSETVYQSACGGGEFSSDDQRRQELDAAKQAILAWIDRRDVDA
jgi:hypothetical protein